MGSLVVVRAARALGLKERKQSRRFNAYTPYMTQVVHNQPLLDVHAAEASEHVVFP